MSKGYVYVLSNPSIPGLLKIGQSINGGKSRASNLFQTGLPTPFILEFEMLFNDCANAESSVHSGLSDFREAQNREFFRVSVYEAIVAILTVAAHEIDHQMMPVAVATAIEAADYFAKKLGRHLFEVCSAFQLLSDFSVQSVMIEHDRIVAERVKSFDVSRSK